MYFLGYNSLSSAKTLYNIFLKFEIDILKIIMEVNIWY